MRFPNHMILAAAATLLVAGAAFADKASEVADQAAKPWSLGNLPPFLSPQADVNETEGLNDVCPGEPYLPGDVYHAAITAGDHDYVSFSANAGDMITVGTDADGTPTVDTYLQLLADDCSTVLAFDDDGGPGLYSLISNFAAPYTGNYVAHVRGFGTASAGLYKLLGAVQGAAATDCPLDNYKGLKFDTNIAIPDNNAAGIDVGPLQFFPDGNVILDLVVDLGITHTWVGDLVVTLRHEGPSGTQSVDLINRPGVPATSFGCSGDLIGSQTAKYYFGTNPTLDVLGESSCGTTIPLQCYQVAPENPNGLMQFRGLPKDGAWYLHVSDNAGGDTGTLWDYSIHALNQAPVAVEPSSWGSVKAQYR